MTPKVKCKGTFYVGAWPRPCECDKNASTPAGYCKRHDPEEIKKRDAIKHARWDEESKKRNAVWRMEKAAPIGYALAQMVIAGEPLATLQEKAREVIKTVEGDGE